MDNLIKKILILPKELQKMILSYIPHPKQCPKLLNDIRDFTVSLNRLKNLFKKVIINELDNYEIYSIKEINEIINCKIYHKLLLELMYSISNSQYFYCTFIRLFMASKKWIQKYQQNVIKTVYILNKPNVENNIRFIFGIMTPDERYQMINYYYYNRNDIEEDMEEEDYDW
jgi:hypothetical protein